MREDFAVVVHAKNPVTDLSAEELRRLFRAEKQFWKQSSPVDLLLPRSGSSAKEALLARVYGMKERELKRYWTEMIYRSRIVEDPRAMPSPTIALGVLARTTGGVTVVSSNALPRAAGVKVLTIAGLRPGDPAYPLWIEVDPTTIEASAAEVGVPLEASANRQSEEAPIVEPRSSFERETPGLSWNGLAAEWPPVNVRFFGHAEYEYERAELDGERTRKSGFSVESLDVLATSALNERVSVLVEAVMDALDEGGFEIELARMLVKYRLSDALSIEAGRFLTGIGYWNSRYHHGEWIQTSIDRPAVLDFEDEGGLLPIHSVGLSFKGAHFADFAALDYTVELTNGRGSVADGPQVKGDGNIAKAVNVSFGVEPTAIPGLRVGGGVYWDDIPENTDPDLGPEHGATDERILNAYGAYVAGDWEIMGEYFTVDHSEGGGEEVDSRGWYAQVGRRFGDFTPYVRVDEVERGDADTFYPTMENTSTWAVGMRYDFMNRAALTLQYEDTNGRAAPGVEEGEDTQTAVLQLSFAI